MEVVGRVLCVRLKNIWTKKFVEQVFIECQRQVAHLTDQPWAGYIDIRDWIMPSPEALEGFQMIYDWCADNNQTHETTVCRFDTQKQIIGDVSGYAPEYHFFTSAASSAEQWLNQRGFNFSLPDNYR